MEKTVSKSGHTEDDAFESCMKLYYLPLYHFLGGLVKDRAKAEDLVQESFLRLHRQLEWSYVPENIWSWLYRVATNLSRDYWKSSCYQKEIPVIDSESIQKDCGPAVMERYEWFETCAELQELVNKLPFKYKEIINLRFYQELKLHEIAERVDCPIGTVKSRLFYALRLLNQKVEENGRHAYELYRFNRG